MDPNSLDYYNDIIHNTDYHNSIGIQTGPYFKVMYNFSLLVIYTKQ